MDLLRRLDAIDGAGRLTGLGEVIRRLPLHPRLGRILVAAKEKKDAALICAILSDGMAWASRELATTGPDIHLLLDRARNAPRSIRVLADSLRSAAPAFQGEARTLDEAMLRGYPDRVAKRRELDSPRVLLSSGHGAKMAGGGLVPRSEFIVALEVSAGDRGQANDSLIRLAAPLGHESVEATSTRVEHRLEGGKVRAYETRLMARSCSARTRSTPIRMSLRPCSLVRSSKVDSQTRTRSSYAVFDSREWRSIFNQSSSPLVPGVSNVLRFGWRTGWLTTSGVVSTLKRLKQYRSRVAARPGLRIGTTER